MYMDCNFPHFEWAIHPDNENMLCSCYNFTSKMLKRTVFSVIFYQIVTSLGTSITNIRRSYQAYLEKLKQPMQKARKYACNCMATGPWFVIHLSINFMCTFDNWKWKKNTEVLLIRGSIDLFLTQKREWSRYASFAFREITVTDIYGEDLFSLTLSCIAATQFKRLSAY